MASSETQSVVQLWWAELDDPGALAQDEAALAASELERASRFASHRDRDRFVATRAHLRRLLGALLGLPAAEVEFAEGEAGKPSVPGSGLRFSASRSGGAALFATSWVMEVGVDLERIGDGREVQRIAARFFTPSERSAIGRLPAEARVAAAFRCWSCKEAYVKGTGEGLSADVASLEVWSAGAPSTAIGGWRVFPLELDPGFAAAVAGQSLDPWAPGRLQRL